MKQLLIYALAVLGSVLLTTSCSDTGVIEPGADGQTGTLTLRISGTRVEPESYNPFDHLSVRIYDDKDALVRKYTSIASIPATLQLLGGDYRITVEAGDRSAASFTNKSYYGEKLFTITPASTQLVEISCKLINSVAQVKFDASIAQNFGKEFNAQVCASDAYNAAGVADGTIPALEYTSDKAGYFILPNGVKNFSWSFSGTHPKKGVVEKTGVIENIEPGYKYTLSLRYSPDLPGYISLELTVDTSTDDIDDTIIFSPEPSIAGLNFNMDEVQKYISGEKTFEISTIDETQSVKLTLDTETYDLLNPTAPGITTVRKDNYNMTVTFNNEFFAGKPGGDHLFQFQISDNSGGTLNAQTTFLTAGLVPVSAEEQDLWSNTVTLKALVFDPTISTVTFALRKTDGEWIEMAGTRQDDAETFTATFAPEWSESTNDAGLTIYTPNANQGVFASNSYEYKATFDTQLIAEYAFVTTAGDTISNAGMEEWSTYNVTGSIATGGSVPYPNANSGVQYWVGGNNKTTNTLCTGAEVEGCNGAKCAKLQPVEAAGIFAAGNLFTGTFSCGTGLLDMFGFASFGLKHDFTMRPRGLKIHYNATITKITNTGGSSLTTNDLDSARIFVCITDWTSRHTVKSGKTYDESTFWNPAKITSLAEGAILGYGMITRGESTEGWVTETIPINWYDTQAKPTAGNYSYTISSATSAYGDYVAGSTHNLLYIEDFEWVY